MGKRVAIVQSNYIPWKGYFDLVGLVDEFILFDDRQYTRRDWRNRNRVKTAQGVVWLTIPVDVKGKYEQRIDETRIADLSWAERHWTTLAHAFRAAPAFETFAPRVRAAYERVAKEPLLSVVNRAFIELVCEMLGISTTLRWSTEYAAAGTRTERLVELCVEAGATTYLSGPAAQAYIDESLFAVAGVALEYMDYSGYPEYPQLYPPFEHAVTILDLIFNVGTEAPRYLKSFTA